MFDLLDAKGLLEKQGNRYKFIMSNGDEILEFRKRWTGDLLDKVMADLPAKEAQVAADAAEADRLAREAELAELDAQLVNTEDNLIEEPTENE